MTLIAGKMQHQQQHQQQWQQHHKKSVKVTEKEVHAHHISIASAEMVTLTEALITHAKEKMTQMERSENAHLQTHLKTQMKKIVMLHCFQ